MRRIGRRTTGDGRLDVPGKVVNDGFVYRYEAVPAKRRPGILLENEVVSLFKGLCLLALMFLAPLNVAYSAKFALVIGNSQYKSVPTLPNPTNDADAVAAALKRLGFDVSIANNATKVELERTLADFSEKAADAEMSIVFYAGHGIEVGGENYLIPVDATLKSDTRVRFEAIALNDILSAIEGGSGIKLVLLDACRDNPFAATMRGTKTRSVSRGLARVEATDGIYISYAAAAGTTASDGDGKHSPYTEALLATIEEPGLELNFLFRKVAGRVKQATGGMQTPFEYGRLPDVSVYLKPPVEETRPPVKDECTDAAAHWLAVANKGSRSLFQAHLDHFGQCAFADLAREALANLDKAAPDATNEEKPVETSLAMPEKVPEQTDLPSLTRGIQEGLARVGCEPGATDGRWGRQSQNAMERFNKFASLGLDVVSPSKEALAALANRTSRVCPLECSPIDALIDGQCVRKTCPAGQALNKLGQCLAQVDEVPARREKKERQQKTGNSAKSDNCFVLDGQRFCM